MSSPYSGADAAFDAEQLHGETCPRHGTTAPVPRPCECCIDCGAAEGTECAGWCPAADAGQDGQEAASPAPCPGVEPGTKAPRGWAPAPRGSITTPVAPADLATRRRLQRRHRTEAVK